MKWSNDFSHDLALGQLGEDYVGEVLSGSTIEIKTDLKAQKTGNVYVEYESRGKPSGLATSEADFWAFVINDRIIIVPLEKLKRIARQFYATSSAHGGDNNTSRGVLIPIAKLVLLN